MSCCLTIIAVPTLVEHKTKAKAQVMQILQVPPRLGVKITSPSKNTTVLVGQLTISGISSDTAITNCMVSADWNDLKPMQNVTAKGPGGAMIIQFGHILTTKPTII